MVLALVALGTALLWSTRRAPSSVGEGSGPLASTSDGSPRCTTCDELVRAAAGLRAARLIGWMTAAAWTLCASHLLQTAGAADEVLLRALRVIHATDLVVDLQAAHALHPRLRLAPVRVPPRLRVLLRVLDPLRLQTRLVSVQQDTTSLESSPRKAVGTACSRNAHLDLHVVSSSHGRLIDF